MARLLDPTVMALRSLDSGADIEHYGLGLLPAAMRLLMTENSAAATRAIANDMAGQSPSPLKESVYERPVR